VRRGDIVIIDTQPDYNNLVLNALNGAGGNGPVFAGGKEQDENQQGRPKGMRKPVYP
jgi:hypothetical protein